MDAIQIVSVSIGFFLILLLLALVFWRRNLTGGEYTFARIVLALAIACIAVILTGFLNVEIKGSIQAGGAFAAFVIVLLFKPAALQGSSEWQNIRQLWRPLRDLNVKPKDVSQDDLVAAINALNETARLIQDDDSLFRSFKADYGDSFCKLYLKLTKNKYPVLHENSTSDVLLTLTTKKLAERIPCK